MAKNIPSQREADYRWGLQPSPKSSVPGFLLITGGIDFLWPTFSTVLMWPILVFLYVRLAREEETKLEEKFGEEYREYAKKVSRFKPKWRLIKEALE